MKIRERVDTLPLQANAEQPTIGKLIDDAMLAIENNNASLKGVLPKEYTRPNLDKIMLGELIDLISGIAMHAESGSARDILGRIYEYFLSGFAGAEGKRGGRVLYPAFCGSCFGRDAGAL